MGERRSLTLPERVDAEGRMAAQIAAERGVQPFEVMFNMNPRPRAPITWLDDDVPDIMSPEFEAGLDAEAEMLRRVEAGESVEDVFGGPSIDPAKKPPPSRPGAP